MLNAHVDIGEKLNEEKLLNKKKMTNQKIMMNCNVFYLNDITVEYYITTVYTGTIKYKFFS